MLSGHKAFTDTSIGRLTVKLVQEPAPPIQGLSPQLQAVLERAHAKRPEERFASATAMADALRQTMQSASASGPARPANTIVLRPPSTRTVQAVPVDSGVTRDIERLLAAYVGPLARHLVQRALEQPGSADTFLQSLAAAIEDQAQRAKFLSQAGNALRSSTSAFSGSGATQATRQPATPSRVPAEACERVARDLARHLGPIAPVLVRQVALSVASVEQLRAALAPHIDDEAARRAFLAGR